MAVLRRAVAAPRPPREYGPESAAADARKIADQHLIKPVPFDVFGLASVLGVPVIPRPMEPNISGYFRNSADGFQIGVNSLHHPNRQRFTVAHEIGHFMLHREHGSFEDGLLFRNNQFNQQEREANLFAALLLMPDREFKPAVARYELEELARTFGVSQQAVKYRIEQISQSAIW